MSKITESLTGTNFWVNFLLLIGSLWGLNADTANTAVFAVFGLVAAAGAVRGAIVHAKFTGFKTWISSANTWSYLTGSLVMLVPAAEPLLPGLRGLSDALIEGNWSKILTAGLSLLTIVWYTFIKKP